MHEAPKTLIQFVLIGLVGLAAGFTANALRGPSAIRLSKNYFDTGAALVEIAKQSAPAGADDTSAREDSIEASTAPAAESKDGEATQPHSTDADGSTEGKHLDHPYQTITYEEIVSLLEDPLTQAGLNVFVDARNEQSFAEGHIPGAMLCNPYEVASYIDREIEGQTMLDRILAAEKVIVYCGGGDCADSVFMCRELLELDVPYSSIYLYEGGWKDWIARGGPVESGGAE